jgi:hypothetical protein
MNAPLKNNYIQYLTRNNKLKIAPLMINDNSNGRVGSVYISTLIQEEFFIVAVYYNNVQTFGLGFDNLENDPMLAVINSPFTDVSLILEQDFFPPLTPVVFSCNRINMDGTGERLWMDRAQKTEQYLDFEEYLNYHYPTNAYIIRPFQHGLALNFQINPSPNNMIFSAMLEDSTLIMKTIPSLNRRLFLGSNDSRSQPKKGVAIFHTLTFNTWSGFGGVTPDSYVEYIHGYVAIFQNLFF